MTPEQALTLRALFREHKHEGTRLVTAEIDGLVAGLLLRDGEHVLTVLVARDGNFVSPTWPVDD